MVSATPGIHHVTAMVGEAQANLDFYAGVLGLRLVKRTVNQEDMLRYHFFYGDESGRPGTLFTCFPYPDQPPGRVGKPQWAAASFAVPPGSLDYWTRRLADHGVDAERDERFGDSLLRFTDPSGTHLELVAAGSPVDPWTDGPVPADRAIRSLHGATALPTNPYTTASVLETLGFDLVGQAGERIRYAAGGDHATAVDLLDREAAYGREGRGTVHHVAMRVPDSEAVFDWHERFRERDDVVVSRVRDRYYYTGLYVREPGGILVELAAEGPGLTRDEPVAELGRSLALPDTFERDRDLIEDQLPPVEVPNQ